MQLPEKEARLAGLGFSFSPVKIALPSKGESRSRPSSAGGRPVEQQTSQQHQLRPGTSKAVSFNLKARKPGAAYSSPQLLRPQDNAVGPARPCSANSACSSVPADHWRLHGEAGSVDSAVGLQHSLKQHPAAIPAAAEAPPAAARAAGLARLKEVALARRRASLAEAPLLLQQAGGEEWDEAEDQEDPAVQQQSLTAEDASLLHHSELLLAGCGPGAVAEYGHAPSPRHMQLVSIPDRAWAEQEGDCEEAPLPLQLPAATSPQRRVLRPGDVLPQPAPAHSTLGKAERGLNPALHPAGGEPGPLPGGALEAFEEPSIHRVHAILSSITFPASPAAPPSPGPASVAVQGQLQLGQPPPLPPQQQQRGGGNSKAAVPTSCEPNAVAVQPAEQGSKGVELPAVPTTLQEALELLGLSVDEDGGDSSNSAQGPAVYLAPLWLKLRAAELVVAAKQQAGKQALRQLLARLRHIRANLEFHNANASRTCSRTPPRQRPPSVEHPWLSGNSSSATSKHKRARSKSPGPQLPPRPTVGPTTQEASKLQVKLLSNLLPKLWLKLGVTALRHSAALARLRLRLLAHIQLTGGGKLCIRALRAWKEVAVPSETMVAASERLRRELRRRQKLRLLRAWRAWVEHRRWQHERVQRGRSVYHRQLKLAALSHWRVYCQERHVARLQQALATRWLSTWSKRKVFTVWRQVARRGALLKQAMLGRIAGGSRGGGSSSKVRGSAGSAAHSPLPSLLEALAVTHGAFQSVKDYVSSAGQELQQMRGDLRFGSRPLQLLEEEQPQPSSLAPSSLAPVGSLRALLALLQPPLQAQPGLAPGQDLGGQELPWKHLRLPAAPPQEDRRLGSSLDPLAAAQPLSPVSSPPPAQWCAINTESPGALLQPPSAETSPVPSPSYSPSRYASPTKQPSMQRRPQPPRLPALRPEAIQAEMEGHMAAVAHIRRELEAFEKEAAELQQHQAGLERQVAMAEQEAALCWQGSMEAGQAKQSTAQALQAAIERHTEASTRCAFLERQVQQQELVYRQALGDEAEAKAGAQAAAEQQAVASIAAGAWTKKVDSVARELSQCHRTQQPVVAARLQEARQQQQQQQQEVASLQASMAQLKQAAKEAGSRAERALQKLHATRAEMVAAVDARALLQQQMKALMEAHERHAVESVAKEQAATAAEQAQRQAAQQRQLGSQRLQSIAAQVLVRQQDAQQLTERVAELQQLQRQAAGATLAAAKFKRSGHRRAARMEAAAPRSAASPSASPPGERLSERDAGLARLSMQPGVGWARPLLSLPSTSDSSASAGTPPGGPAQPPLARGGHFVLPAAAAPAVGAAGALACSDWSELSSLCSSPRLASPPPPWTVDEAAEAFYGASLLRHAFSALRREVARAREQVLLAEQHFARRALSKGLAGWRQAAAEMREWLEEVLPVLRRRGCLRRWVVWVGERKRLRECEERLHEAYCRRLLLQGLLALRAHAQHQRWRDAVHEAVVRLRWHNMLRGWREWARGQRVDAVALARARTVYDRRLLSEAWRQWAWVARNKALLRRVFQTAVDLWREEVGALLHTRNYEVMEWAFRTWQLHVLEQQEQRRQQILRNAAAAFREKQLLLAGLQAFQVAVQARREQWRLLALRAEAFAEWWRLAVNSPRHWDCVVADNQRRRCLLRTALATWSEVCAGTAHQLARFWLRWQVRMPLHRTFVVWRAVARWQRQEEQYRALALAFRRLLLLQKAMRAWRQAAPLLHEKRVLRGMAEAHYAPALAWRTLAAWRLAAAQARKQQQHGRGRGADENAPAPALALAAPPLRPRKPWAIEPSGTSSSVIPPACRLGSPKPMPQTPLLGRRTAASPRRPQHAASSRELASPPPQQTVVIVQRTLGPPTRAPSQQRQQQQVQQMVTVHTGGSLEEAVAAHPEVQAMLQSVAAWKGSATHWRQRLGSRPGSLASPGAAAVAVPTAGAAAQGRAGQQQQQLAESPGRAFQHRQRQAMLMSPPSRS